MEIFANEAYAQEFIRGILPAGIQEDTPSNQSDIPAHLANHPSMQGHKSTKVTPAPTLDNMNTTPAAQPPAIADDREYQDYLAYKAARDAQTSPDRVSSPESPQEGPGIPANLI